MKIAIAHFRVGETDGVSLEMEKWKKVLEELGHEVIFLAGSKGDSSAYLIDELHYQHPLNNKIVRNAYDELSDYTCEEELNQEILAFALRIEEKLLDFIEQEKIEVIMPNNIWSLGWHLAAGIAFARVARQKKVSFVAHHHDFYWERERYARPTCPFVTQCLEEYFPPAEPNVTHVVINEIARRELWQRKGIAATVVPNVFDFSKPSWAQDEYNADFRQRLGIDENDILILQATRVTERKAIELGIDVVAEMQQVHYLERLQSAPLYDGRQFGTGNKLVYVLAGLHEAEAGYIQALRNKADKLGVDLRFVNQHIDFARRQTEEEKIYSLWDAYVAADLITYPSIMEGWGNQLLEGVFAKKPLVIYEYPVFVTDIKSKPFSFISLGDQHTVNRDGLVEVAPVRIQQAAARAIELLLDGKRREKMVNTNFEIAKLHFSYESLQGLLAHIMDAHFSVDNRA